MDPNINKLPASNMHAVGNSGDSFANAGDESKANQESLMSNDPLQSSRQLKRSGDTTSPDQLSTPASQPRTVQQHVASGASASAAGQNDEDDMAIEKECIRKAKEIIEQTSGDPFTQTKELNKVKAELLSRRFGKELKTGEA